MKKLILATVIFSAAAATTAMAAGESYYLIKDTVGNCAAVIDTNGADFPGMTVMSKKTYSSLDEANKALPDLKGCKGIVQ